MWLQMKPFYNSCYHGTLETRFDSSKNVEVKSLEMDLE
jgi:hypothetical protein